MRHRWCLCCLPKVKNPPPPCLTIQGALTFLCIFVLHFLPQASFASSRTLVSHFFSLSLGLLFVSISHCLHLLGTCTITNIKLFYSDGTTTNVTTRYATVATTITINTTIASTSATAATNSLFYSRNFFIFITLSITASSISSSGSTAGASGSSRHRRLRTVVVGMEVTYVVACGQASVSTDDLLHTLQVAFHSPFIPLFVDFNAHFDSLTSTRSSLQSSILHFIVILPFPPFIFSLSFLTGPCQQDHYGSLPCHFIPPRHTILP